MECEISFRLMRDLPARTQEYSEQEVFDALEGCAAFELVDSRFRDLKSAMDNTPYEFYADHIANGAMVFGPYRKDWQKFDFSKTRVSMKQGGRTIIEKTGGHPTGNPAKPAVVLANLRRGTNRSEGRHVHRHRLVHRISSGRARPAGDRGVRRLRNDGSDDRGDSPAPEARQSTFSFG